MDFSSVQSMPADANARMRIRTAVNETLVVEAAAGTGKTTELVHRIVHVLATGRALVEEVVAVTFTEKAAGELKLRLRAALERAREQDGGRLGEANGTQHALRERNLEKALSHLEEAHVSTIHGFCADLLRERPVEAKVDPRFETLSEPEAKRLYAEAFDRWLQERLEAPPEGVRRSLRRSSSFGGAEGPVARLRNAGWTLVTWRDFPAPWGRDLFDRDRQIDALVEQLHELANLTRHPSRKGDYLFRDMAAGRRLSDSIRVAEKVKRRDYDGLEAALVDLCANREFRQPRKGSGYQYGGDIKRPEVLASHERLAGSLQRFVRDADADLATLLHDELLESIDRYETLKARAGRLDFVDLLVRARDLIRDNDQVRADFGRFTHLFVDEFQDTDPLQAEILLLLASDNPSVRDWRAVTPTPGKLFIVGDPKQSIYRFRRADVGTYQEVKDLLVARGGVPVQLTTSFRATPPIQKAVNAAFSPLMTGDRDALQPAYVPLEPHRSGPLNQPSVVVLPVPEPYGMKRIAASAIEKSLPDAVGAFVEWLISKSGWTVTERSGGAADRSIGLLPGARIGGGVSPLTTAAEHRVAVAARHVCLLFRRFDSWGTDVTRPYVEALEARDVPHLLVGGKSFHHREEVETIRAALTAVEWPDDELAVFATLKGSLFAIGDEALLQYRHRFRRLHPFRIPDGDVASNELGESAIPIERALRLLQLLHRQRNYRPVTDTIGLLLAETRAHAGFVLRPSGEQALANVLQIAEMARAYENSGGISFRGFVDLLRQEAESGEAPEAPILEEGSDGVRLMTVHKAKGLEFPVVVLADITANLAQRQASRYIDAERRLCAVRISGWSPTDLLTHEAEELRRDEAESVRVAYVAATRARDVLVVPAVGDEAYEGKWISPLNTAIYPARANRRSPENAPGCPRFGGDTVLNRPDGDPARADTVAPGLHRLGPTANVPPDVVHMAGRSSTHEVVWWDPKALTLGAEPTFAFRQNELIAKDADRAVVEADRKAYECWRAARASTLERGSRPSVIIHTATERASSGGQPSPGQELAPLPEADGEVEIIQLARDIRRPAGPRYGVLVHAVLAAVRLDADLDQVQDMTELQGRILGATGEEIVSAAAVVQAVLVEPIIGRAREAARRGECRREAPVTFCETDGALVEGVVDLAFRDAGGWTVIDFKTDRELEKALEIYRRQVRFYAAVVARATGDRTSAVLMRV